MHCEKDVIVTNRVGLHTKPLTAFICRSHLFKSSIQIKKDEKLVNGKSLFCVLGLEVLQGDTITLIADGDDAEKAIEELSSLIESNFDNV